MLSITSRVSHNKVFSPEDTFRYLFDLDGLDEISEFSVMYENSSSQYDVDHETDWSDIIVNVLRRNLLPEATVVLFSR